LSRAPVLVTAGRGETRAVRRRGTAPHGPRFCRGSRRRRARLASGARRQEADLLLVLSSHVSRSIDKAILKKPIAEIASVEEPQETQHASCADRKAAAHGPHGPRQLICGCTLPASPRCTTMHLHADAQVSPDARPEQVAEKRTSSDARAPEERSRFKINNQLNFS